MNKVKLNDLVLLQIEKFPLTLKEVFEKVLNNFIAAPPLRVFNFLETIVLSCVLVEAVVKNRLKSINPTLVLERVEPEIVAVVSGKEKKLIDKPNFEISDIKTAGFQILLDRLSKFENITKYQSGLQSFAKLRNKIVHSADNVTLQESQISVLLTKHVFPFIKEHVDINQHTWEAIDKIAFVAHDQYRSDLVRVIVEHRNFANKLKHEEWKKLINSATPGLGKGEMVRLRDLTCPSCHNATMSLVDGVDVEYGDEGVTPFGYFFTICRVCGLKLESVEIEEVVNNPKYYFSPTEDQLSEWQSIFEPSDGDYYNFDK